MPQVCCGPKVGCWQKTPQDWTPPHWVIPPQVMKTQDWPQVIWAQVWPQV
jgi:hypothetical protein